MLFGLQYIKVIKTTVSSLDCAFNTLFLFENVTDETCWGSSSLFVKLLTMIEARILLHDDKPVAAFKKI